MGDPRGDLQTSLQRADPHGFLVPFYKKPYKKSMWIGVLWAGLQVAVRQARKNNIKINFLGPETARWGGDLPREGVVAEKFVPSLESLSSLGLGCCGPGKLPKKGKSPKVVRGGCKRFF